MFSKLIYDAAVAMKEQLNGELNLLTIFIFGKTQLFFSVLLPATHHVLLEGDGNYFKVEMLRARVVKMHSC
jgi:hypothetical protein